MTEHEELLLLRKSAEKQQQELARKKLFGQSTEVSKHVDGQLSLFDTSQKLAEELAREQKKITVPAPPLAHSISTPSLIAQVMYQKFVMGMPFARQEKDWYRLGLGLPRADMANWSVRCCEEWLEPIYDRIHEQLLGCQVLHMDETRIQCNKEDGKKAGSESFMRVMRSAECEEVAAACFCYSRSRSGGVARLLLSGFDGYLITDAYSGYGTVEDITSVLCRAHCRRCYIESIPLDNNGKEIPGSKGAEGREYISCLFKAEEQIKDLPYEAGNRSARKHQGLFLMPFGRGYQKRQR